MIRSLQTRGIFACHCELVDDSDRPLIRCRMLFSKTKRTDGAIVQMLDRDSENFYTVKLPVTETPLFATEDDWIELEIMDASFQNSDTA